MARSTYAIRKGFEYQDLFCALELAHLIEDNFLDAEFFVESTEIEYVDDLQIRQSDRRVGCQVKFHVRRDYFDSFTTLVYRRTEKSLSLLAKLFEGWKALSGNGDKSCELRFVSSAYPEGGDGELASAIDTETGQFAPRFFDDSAYDTARESWIADLSCDIAQLRQFLSSVRWEFAQDSFSVLNERLRRSLARIGFPSHDTALVLFIGVIGYYATNVQEFSSIASLIVDLARLPEFRDACEQRFSHLLGAVRGNKRASLYRVATIDIQGLPHFRSTSFACDEEPAPLAHYENGLTVAALSNVYDSERAEWQLEHARWLRARIQRILESLREIDLDCIVFPRLIVSLDAALEVHEWCQQHSVHAVFSSCVGKDTAETALHLENLLNVRVTDLAEKHVDDDKSIVADIVLRHDRVGRASLSALPSPATKKDELLSSVMPSVLSNGGHELTIASLSSRAAVAAFTAARHAAPDLLISSCSPNGEMVASHLATASNLIGVPAVTCQSSPAESSAFVISGDDQAAVALPPWEGVTVFEIRYDREGTKSPAIVATVERIPIVYHEVLRSRIDQVDPQWLADIRGLARSVATVQFAFEQGRSAEPLICIVGDDPDNFFLRRLRDANAVVRESFIELKVNQMNAARQSVAEIEQRLTELETTRVREPVVIFETPQVQPLIRPSLVDRSEETRVVSRFCDGSSNVRVLLVHGRLGIGKSSIIRHCLRVGRHSQSVFYATAFKNSTFGEFLGLMLRRSGKSVNTAPTPSDTVYKDVCDAIKATGRSLIVIDHAENLPLGGSQAEHPHFLAFLAFICTSPDASGLRLLLSSSRRAVLRGFSGSHLAESLPVEGLDNESTLQLLQELVASGGCDATAQELETLGKEIDGDPGLAYVVASLLREIPATELISNLYKHAEVTKYIVNQSLKHADLDSHALALLKYASVFRIPVKRDAFIGHYGARTRGILADLADRLMVSSENDQVMVHRSIAAHFRSTNSTSDARDYHRRAYRYCKSLVDGQNATLEEIAEMIFHGTLAGECRDLREFALLLGSAREAMMKAFKDRDYPALKVASAVILQVTRDDPIARIANGIALDEEQALDDPLAYSDALIRVDPSDLWFAVEFVKQRIRKHDFKNAATFIEALEQRYGRRNQILLAKAQLFERDQKHAEATQVCEEVLKDEYAHPSDLRGAARILRKAGQFEILVANLSSSLRDEYLRRMYAYGCVVTGFSRASGLEVLERAWSDDKTDGDAVADFAAALGAIDEDVRAEELFQQGIRDIHDKEEVFPVREEYARFLMRRRRFIDANAMLRELHNQHRGRHHITRRYAATLFYQAKSEKEEGNYSVEDACLQEAERVLNGLTNSAPTDEWAKHLLELVRSRDYVSSIALPDGSDDSIRAGDD